MPHVCCFQKFEKTRNDDVQIGLVTFVVISFLATNDENKPKNQDDRVIPYDRNRVILTPDGQRPHSTYINASFIEGYNNDESFIITQVRMEKTNLEE